MASIKIVLRDKQNKEGMYPVVLRITKERTSKIISLGMDCELQNWDERSAQFKKSMPNYIQKNIILSNLKQKAWAIIDGFNLEDVDFTLTQFEDKFRGKESSKITVLEFWEEKIKDLNLAGRTGNARAHHDTKNSFFKYCKNQKILFKEITVEVVDKYETYLRANGCADGGIGVRMRELRAVFNDAIKKGVTQEKYYPFKIYKVSKLKSSGFKKALTREEVRLIENFDEVKYPHLREAKHLFVFSYYTRGMNYADMMKLTWDNVVDNKIYYSRSKTKGKFIIKILKPVQDILDYYKEINVKTNYVFPILLNEGLTPIQIENWNKYQEEKDKEFVENFGKGKKGEIINEKRLKRAIERAEMLYGTLNANQKEALAKRLEKSVFNVEQVLPERKRRHADSINAVKLIQSGAKPYPTLKAVWDRNQKSPNPNYAAYSDKMLQDGCSQLSELHNKTTLEQRKKAAQKLNGYRKDFESLIKS